MFYEVLMEKRAQKEERDSVRDYAPAGALTAAGLGSAGYGGYRMKQRGKAGDQAINALDKLIELKGTQGKAVTDGYAKANSVVDILKGVASHYGQDDVADRITAAQQQAGDALDSVRGAAQSALEERRALEAAMGGPAAMKLLGMDNLDDAVMNSPEALRKHLARKRMAGRAMLGGGLAAASVGGKMLYDRYRNRNG